MNQQEVEIECKGCNHTLKVFLEEMSAHNKTVQCPHCGKILPHPPSGNTQQKN